MTDRKEINCLNCDKKNRLDHTWRTCRRICTYKYNKQKQDAEYQLERYKQAFREIEANIFKYQELTFDKPRTMQENRCIYNIFDIINKVRGQ